MPGIDSRLTHYIPDNESHVGNPFFENLFSTDIFIVKRIMRALLPEALYDQFIAWQEERHMAALHDVLSRYFSNPVVITRRQVANYAPKYVSYSVVFSGNSDVSTYMDRIQGYGASHSSSTEALSAATGEFLERYVLADDWNGDIHMATPRDLGRRAVSFERAPLFLPWQKEQVNSAFITRENFTDATLSWVSARPLLGMGRKYVPAQRVLWLRDRERGEGIINHSTTNGAGGGFSYQEAVLSALYELVERDSFLCHWLLKISPSRISFETVATPGITKVRSYIRRYKLEVNFYDITTDIGIPAVACFIINRADPNDPKISVGAASCYDAERLFDKSFIEALTIQRRFLQTNEKTVHPESIRAEGYFNDPSFDKDDLSMRSRIWRGRIMENHLQFLQKGTSTTFDAFCSVHTLSSFSSPKKELNHVKGIFKNLVQTYGEGFAPYIYRARHALLSKLHYVVVHAVVPNLFPLYLTEHCATLDISKQQHWRKTAEKKGKKWSEKIENTYPHPFL